MGVKVTNGCLNRSQCSYYFPHSSSPQTLASAISSPLTRHVALVFRYIHRPVIFGTIVNRREKKVSIERKANSFELPFSLRMIQRKKQLKEGVKEAWESAYCSFKKAFSSMVFIICELQSYTLQMREALFYEDLQGVLAKTFEVNSGGKTTSVGGINGGGGKSRPVTSGTNGGESFNWNLAHDGTSVSGREMNEGEFDKWKSLVKEADNMQDDLSLIFLSGDSDHVSLLRVEPREWAGDMILASIERKANSFELPFSLRMIQRKKQLKEGVKEAWE
nr:hypothetical protein [Tanacetum cinerariifolium]